MPLRDRCGVALVRSILVYEDNDENVTARAAFGGRLRAAKHLIWHPIIYSVLPRHFTEVRFGDSEDDCWSRSVWRWRGREIAGGEWREGFLP